MTLVTVGLLLIGVTAQPLWRVWKDFDRRVVRWVSVDELPNRLGLYDSVFWEPLDTQSFRALLLEQPQFIENKRVLEIGTGSGLLAICCMKHGAQSVVATDINPQAVDCAKANSKRSGLIRAVIRRMRQEMWSLSCWL